MPKRNIKDLGPNECIHCPTEEGFKKICDMVGVTHPHSTFGFSSVMMKTEKGSLILWDLQSAQNSGRNIYPRTDFVDEEVKDYGDPKDWKRVNPEREEKKSDPIPVSTEISRPGPFRTGDEVEAFIGGYENSVVVFQGYTTQGRYIVYDRKSGEYYEVAECRHIILKHKHTISCTDEVWEKVKEIEGVDFSLDNSQGKSE